MARRSAAWLRGHGYVVLAAMLITMFMATFVVVESLKPALFTDPDAYIDTGTWPVAVVGVGLLVADVLLPIPSSGVMIAQGAAFGFALGSILSLIGGTGATLAAYLVGCRSQRLVDRLVSVEQQRSAAELLERHGVWAIIATRPVPMFAETVAILAGTTNAMAWWKVTAAGAVGNLVPAMAYAAVGAYAASFVNGGLVFAGVLLLAAVAWLVQRSARAAAGGAVVATKRSSRGIVRRHMTDEEERAR